MEHIRVGLKEFDSSKNGFTIVRMHFGKAHIE